MAGGKKFFFDPERRKIVIDLYHSFDNGKFFLLLKEKSCAKNLEKGLAWANGDIKSGTSILGLKSKSGSLRLPVWASGHYQTGTLWKVELYQQILKILPQIQRAKAIAHIFYLVLNMDFEFFRV